ncbi:MAG: tRNA adenosine(34) deaminase TadA [Candidatus Eisenbacteria bacterium]
MSRPDRDHERWMRLALQEAEEAALEGEVPVGAVVVHEERVIGRGHNRTEGANDPTAHAEILAIGAASEALGSWRLEGATLYVTLEPCYMCAGAIVLARLERVVFGATDPKAGACVSLADVVRDPRLNHRAEVEHGVLEEESRALLEEFFRKKREKSREKPPSD